MNTNDTSSPAKSKRLFGAGMLTAGLVAGAMFSPLGFAGAQDSADDDGTTTEAPNSERRGHRHHRGEILESLGIDAEAVRAGIEADQTLAEIAEANGVSEDELIGAIEADVEAHVAEAVENGRITQEQADEKLADLTDTITERVNTPPSERPEREGRGHRGRFGGGEVLEELGLTVEDLRDGFTAGQTLAETAEANGVSEDELVDALVAQATERAEAAVESGRIDSDRADELLDGIEERIINKVNAEPRDRSERGLRGRFGGADGDDVEDSSPSF